MIQLAAATICFDAFDDTNFVHSFENLPACGYRYVEFNAWFPQNLTFSKARDLKRRCEKSGLVPAVLHGNGLGGVDRNDLSRDIAHKLRMLEVAVEIGCRRICFTGSNRGTNGGLPHIIEVLENITPAAEELDVLICLENHANNNLETIEDYQHIFDAVDSPMLGICLDDGHFDASDVDMNDLLNRLGHQVNHVHVKENRTRGKVDFVRFGEGTTDHAGILAHLNAIGFEGFATVEISPAPGRPTTRADMTHAREVISRMSGFATSITSI